MPANHRNTFAWADASGDRYVLRLFVTGTTPRSSRAVVNLRRICEQHLAGRYELEVVDIARHPERAVGEQILAAPTLLKRAPLPQRRLIGDLSETNRVLSGLDLAPAGPTVA